MPPVPPPPPIPKTEDATLGVKAIGELKWIKILLWAILTVNIGSCVNTCSTNEAVRAERIIRPIR